MAFPVKCKHPYLPKIEANAGLRRLSIFRWLYGFAYRIWIKTLFF